MERGDREGDAPGRGRRRVRAAGLAGGPLAAALVFAVLPDGAASGADAAALGAAGRAVAATAVWMAIWWMTEAVPLPATSLLPLVLLPVTAGLPVRDVASPYAHELIFLFLGGFVIALAIERWDLHRRIALATLLRVGESPRRVTAGFMGVTALLSMWVSNTATAVMMLPIAVSVAGMLADASDEEGSARLATALLLAVAYAASIGGTGTLIGTPPNLFMASFVSRELGVQISFASWLAVGLPLVAVFLPFAWWVLVSRFPLERDAGSGASRNALRRGLAELGPLSRGEKLTLAVFLAVAAAWVGRPLLVRAGLEGLTDAGIAMTGAVTLFALPVRWREGVFVMDWATAKRLPWDVLLLFGGGLSLAEAIRSTGVGDWLGHQLAGLAGAPAVAVVVLVVALVIFLTELTSNTATTATLLPILTALAPVLDLDPLLLAAPAAIAASCAFMLPVATPPNAVVFGSGRVPLPAMLRAGLFLNLFGIAWIPVVAFFLVAPLLRG